MARNHTVSRRTALKLTGAAATTALVAGCTGDDDDDDDDGDDGDNGDNGDNGGDGVEIEPGTEIIFDGQMTGWVGISPDEIEGEDNPTLILEDGEDYTIGWEEGDGSVHNIELRDSDGEVVDDYETDEVDEPDDDQMIDFTATSEIVEYVCDPHENQMAGDIEVQ